MSKSPFGWSYPPGCYPPDEGRDPVPEEIEIEEKLQAFRFDAAGAERIMQIVGDLVDKTLADCPHCERRALEAEAAENSLLTGINKTVDFSAPEPVKHERGRDKTFLRDIDWNAALLVHVPEFLTGGEILDPETAAMQIRNLIVRPEGSQEIPAAVRQMPDDGVITGIQFEPGVQFEKGDTIEVKPPTVDYAKGGPELPFRICTACGRGFTGGAWIDTTQTLCGDCRPDRDQLEAAKQLGPPYGPGTKARTEYVRRRHEEPEPDIISHSPDESFSKAAAEASKTRSARELGDKIRLEARERLDLKLAQETVKAGIQRVATDRLIDKISAFIDAARELREFLREK